jgi:AbiV family abortive infection protein
MAMSFNQLKVNDIEKIFCKIYENACELIEDAELLYNHEKYASAYLCAHIAFEEFGKLPMLNTVALNVHYGMKTDWKKLNKRIRDHKRKLSQSYGTISFVIEELSKEINTDSYEENQNEDIKNSLLKISLEEIKDFINNHLEINPERLLEHTFNANLNEQAQRKYSISMLLNDYKNSSLYADFIDGNFMKPSESIDKEICIFGIIIALTQKKFIDLPKIHFDGFKLDEISDEIKEELENLKKWYKESLENLSKTK